MKTTALRRTCLLATPLKTLAWHTDHVHFEKIDTFAAEVLDLVGWECLDNDVSAVDGAWFGILGFGAADFRFRVAPFFLLGHLPW